MKLRIIVCGLDYTGYTIFCLLRQQGAWVVGISDRPIPEEDAVVVGDLQAASTLLAAGIQEAQTLVIARDDDALNLAILMQARLLNPRIRIINRLFNTSLGDRLDRTLPNHVAMSVAALAAPIFVFAALGNHAIGQLRLFKQTWPIYEEYIDSLHPWKDRKLSDLWEDRSRMLIYYLPVDSSMDLISGVIKGQRLQLGDRLIVGTQPSIRTNRQSWLQKLLKMLVSLRQFHQHSRSTVVVFLILLATILTATLTYTSITLGKSSVVDAMYFSVGMITGAGGNEKVAEQASDPIKVFTVIMMLVGAAVIGIGYALLNDFVLGTRFKQFWDVARLPQSDHYIVCGLGEVGVQIVHQLCANGHEVVVIERDPNNRFLTTVRSLHVPVIQGDANLSLTLRTANIHRAAALLVVTSNDIANLETALTAKGLVPKLPVIVRSQDPHYGRMVQQVFEFEAVLSPTDLVAPAFTAAALGGEILGNGMTADNLWIAVATLITPSHPFCGKCVKEVAIAVDFVPLYLETNYQTIHGWELLSHWLSSGDILYLTIPATRLDQLWRTAPVASS